MRVGRFVSLVAVCALGVAWPVLAADAPVTQIVIPIPDTPPMPEPPAAPITPVFKPAPAKEQPNEATKQFLSVVDTIINHGNLQDVNFVANTLNTWFQAGISTGPDVISIRMEPVTDEKKYVLGDKKMPFPVDYSIHIYPNHYDIKPREDAEFAANSPLGVCFSKERYSSWSSKNPNQDTCTDSLCIPVYDYGFRSIDDHRSVRLFITYYNGCVQRLDFRETFHD